MVILEVYMTERRWKMIKRARKISVNGSGVPKIATVWHIMCNKGWGWNKNLTKSFHDKYKANPLLILSQLPTTNLYCYIIKYICFGTKPQTNPSQVPPPLITTESSLTFFYKQMVTNKSKCTSVLEHHECTFKHSEIASMWS